MAQKYTPVGVPISQFTFLYLVDFLRKKGSDRDPVDVIHDAIHYWIDNAEWKEEALMPELFERPSHLGYHWKRLLLPPGTKIRMTYKGQTYHAAVEGDDFVYDGKKISPSEFANTVADGTARNAWRDLWIKRPDDREFRLADELRKAQQRGSGDEETLTEREFRAKFGDKTFEELAALAPIGRSPR